jgi:signal transduction histidine kinase
MSENQSLESNHIPKENGDDLTDSSHSAIEPISQLIIATFHDHATSLKTYWDGALQPVIRALGPSPFTSKGVPPISEAMNTLRSPGKILRSLVKDLISLLEDNWAHRGISDEAWNMLNARLEDLESTLTDMERTPILFLSLITIARDLIDTLETQMSQKNIPREIVKLIIRQAREVERIICFYHLAQVESRVIGLTNQAEALSEYFQTNVVVQEELKPTRFRTLVEKSIVRHEPRAAERRIELRLITILPDVRVLAIERHLQRAIDNLLSNAIKYSWTLSGEKRAWVNIGSYSTSTTVSLEIENWGVPIDPAELENGRIFEYKSRGYYSTDRGRKGTGIGLWDAYTVALQHNGSLSVESRPARKNPDLDKSFTPYVTVVRLELPRCD